MSDIAIRVENLSKQYSIGGPQARYKTIRESLTEAVQVPFRRAAKLLRGQAYGAAEMDETIWALKDVSFEVKRGEVVGIIGRNGAGKTTLLKILSRITEPTEGYAEIHGRVGSLLEVGTGFHPELTGRENITLNGAILGMKRVEINRKFDEIVDFSGVEKFIDTPVKRYSSGMYVRLAFAVAAHLEPEILLVDEVLAVGDVGFQKKCLGKMEDVAQAGRTVLFVSHNMGAISTLCKKAILLTEGRIEFAGPVHMAVSTYLSRFKGAANEVTEKEWAFEEAPGSDKARLKRVAVTGLNDERQYFPTTEPIVVTMEYWVLQDEVPIHVAFWLADENENWIFATNNCRETQIEPINKRGLYRSKCIVPENLLNVGKYTITPVIGANLTQRQLRIDHCITFETAVDRRTYSFEDTGIIKPECEWQTERTHDTEVMDSLSTATRTGA